MTPFERYLQDALRRESVTFQVPANLLAHLRERLYQEEQSQALVWTPSFRVERWYCQDSFALLPSTHGPI
jgi:hypothetical protein